MHEARRVLAVHGWRHLLNTGSVSVWQWKDARLVMVPHRPQGGLWWTHLWDQACNIMHTAHPVPQSPGEWHRATIAELVRKGLPREAHAMARQPNRLPSQRSAA